MKKITFVLFLSISLVSLAQEQHIYSFDTSEESFVGEGGTVSASPTGYVTFTSTTSSYARMAQLVKNVDANTYKYLHIRIKNSAGSNDKLALTAGSSGTIVATLDISTNDTDYKTYSAEITHANWTGAVTPFKFFPKNSANNNLSTAGTIIYDYIIFSNSATLAVQDIEHYKSSLYPNPVKNVLNIKTVNNDIIKLELYNLLGKKVASNINSNHINVENLSKGIYLVQITTETGVSTSKFLKD
ncbi:T9SS type A sorting domain-containing protein [Mariniflexile jejuense]|uniref:T9SS type A sorting domain-containing protein n=1 Tax=Mariniflexile jejuense TaxID=1173582 RepID=A0ABW3JLN8_9FLAO